jgi:hypothetical protein
MLYADGELQRSKRWKFAPKTIRFRLTDEWRHGRRMTSKMDYEQRTCQRWPKNKTQYEHNTTFSRMGQLTVINYAARVSGQAASDERREVWPDRHQ